MGTFFLTSTVYIYGKIQRGQCVSTPGGCLETQVIQDKRLRNNARKRKKKKRQRATDTEWERRSQFGFPKLAEFIYSFSGGGKLTSIVNALLWYNRAF